MKLRFVAISAICVLALCTGLTWAQNGAAARNGGQNGSANCINAPTTTSLQPLTSEEKYWLLYMSREEKLALDVYLELYEKWNLPIFAKIAVSEKRHVDAINKLLLRYNLPYSDGDFLAGEFDDLYTSLIVDGSVSVEGALTVGIAIEKQDIDDLTEALNACGKKDIRTVYENLQAGSKNHLLAFETHLAMLAAN